jgi:hypothetical protein
VAEGGGLLNRTGFHQALTKQAKTRDFLSISLDRNSVLRLPMRREPTRSLHNLLHRPEELRYGSRRVRNGEQRGPVLARAQSGREARCEQPSRVGGRGLRSRAVAVLRRNPSALPSKKDGRTRVGSHCGVYQDFIWTAGFSTRPVFRQSAHRVGRFTVAIVLTWPAASIFLTRGSHCRRSSPGVCRYSST